MGLGAKLPYDPWRLQGEAQAISAKLDEERMSPSHNEEDAPWRAVSLSSKASRFVAEAVEYRLEWYEQQLRRTDLSEDDESDLKNDMQFFRAILEDLRRAANPRSK